MSAPTIVPSPVPESRYRKRWWVLGVVLVADVMDLVDATIAQLAGPEIRADIGGSEASLQWIIAAYTLAFAVGLITSARLGDIVGRRPMFVIGMAGFTLASLACGLAPNIETLIAFRAVQGLFGATMIPQGFAMVKQSFPVAELQRAFIPFGPILGLASVAGPILAGALIEADVAGTGWRGIFLINVPIGLVGTWVAWRFLPDLPSTPGARLDPRGALLISVAAAGVIFTLVQGRELGWPTWLVAVVIGSAVSLGLFVLGERRSPHPLMEPSLFRHRGYVAGLGVLATFYLAMAGLALVLNLYLQWGLGYSPGRTALAQIPYALAMAVGSALSGAYLGPKLGRHVLHIGLVIAAVGVTWFSLVAAHLDTGASPWHFALPFALAGLGSGVIFSPLFDLILADLADHEIGSGSGLLNATQQFSGALGVAALGTLFFHWLPAHDYPVATQWALWGAVICYGLAFVLAFALPLRSAAASALAASAPSAE